MTKHHFLQIGPKRKDSKKIGGIVVAYENFTQNFKYKFNEIDINTNNSSYPKALQTLHIILQCLFKWPKNNTIVIFHATASALIVLGPFLILRKKLFSQKLILRKFAGNYISIFESKNKYIRILIIKVLKTFNMCFFETFELVNYFKKYNIKTYRLPNLRKKESLKNTNLPYSKKFVFLSQIKTTKGVEIILNAFKNLDTSFSLDFYGPIFEDKFDSTILNTKNTSYKGIINPKDVNKTLKNYNVILLPTFHEGEGYPGIIIEGLSLGIPTISTNWNSIGEIINHGENGWLINVKDSLALKNQIESISDKEYNGIVIKALKSFSQFEVENVISYVENIISKNIQ